MTNPSSERPSGVVTPLVTPLTASGALDLSTLCRLVERQLEAGVNGLFLLGSVGEGPLLPEEARIDVLNACKSVVSGSVPVFAGAMDNSTALVLKRLDVLAKVGVDGCAVTLPYYGWPDDPGAATAFFQALADRTPVPIILYNLPRVTGVSLSLSTVQWFYPHPAVVALKDTRDDSTSMAAIASDPLRKDRMTYLPGNSSLAARLLARGADGLISVLTNFAPDLVVAMYRAHRGGDLQRRDRCAEIMTLLSAVTTHPTTAGGVKCALDILGYGDSQTVHPWPRAGNEDRAGIRRLLVEAEARMNSLDVGLIGRISP